MIGKINNTSKVLITQFKQIIKPIIKHEIVENAKRML